MGIRSYITAAQLIAAREQSPVLRLRMKKAAGYEPAKPQSKCTQTYESAPGMKVTDPCLHMDECRGRTDHKHDPQTCPWGVKKGGSYVKIKKAIPSLASLKQPDDCTTCDGSGKVSGQTCKRCGGDGIGTDFIAGKTTTIDVRNPSLRVKKAMGEACAKCGGAFPKYGEGQPHEQQVRRAGGQPIHVGCRAGPQTNPAAVAQIQNARANNMGHLDKAGTASCGNTHKGDSGYANCEKPQGHTGVHVGSVDNKQYRWNSVGQRTGMGPFESAARGVKNWGHAITGHPEKMEQSFAGIRDFMKAGTKRDAQGNRICPTCSKTVGLNLGSQRRHDAEFHAGPIKKAETLVVHECPHCGELASKGCEHSVKAHADQTDILGEK